ncbi:hypothetical protein ACN47E_006495 [Coniothyrium glycines]
MPKKHAPAYASTKPSYVHPSLQSSRTSAPSAPAALPSVSQRIQQLRREQAPRATPEQRDDFTSLAGTRAPRRVGGARPPPGPAAPTSWLQSTRHVSSHLRRGKGEDSRKGVIGFSTLATVTDAELNRLPPPRSLVHCCLRSFAIHWEDLAEYEQHYLPALPTPLKEALLCYLSVHAPRGSLHFKSFKILFQNEQGSGETGWDETHFLDFTDLLGAHLSINDIGRCLKRSTSTLADMSNLRISNADANEQNSACDTVVDSWDDELFDTTPPLVLSAQLQTPHFTNLSRLSLARPNHYASWPDLLRISPSLHKLTHLSLAYWPRPSTTPNATTTSLVSNHTSVSLGGSHFYSDLDDDWHEAANILRRFSTHTYSLRWLDLEGCTWLKALTWEAWRAPTLQHSRVAEPRPTSIPNPSSISPSTDEQWPTPTASPSPDWNDAWRRITYLNASQGWVPADSQSLQNMPAGVVGVQLLSWLRAHKDNPDVQRKLKRDESGKEVAEWVAREKAARGVAAEIHMLRKQGGGEWCRVDYGWG